MQFTMTFEWNDKLVATAQATAVMAYEFARGFFEEQFAGVDHKRWCDENFVNLLDELLAAIKNNTRRTWTLDYKDETGHARLTIRN